MSYSRWSTKEELESKLTKISYDSDIKKSGIPMMYDDKNLYIRDDETHTMVIGATGSGKIQSTLLPLLRLSIKSEESFIVHDVKGEIYNILSGELKKQNYNTVVIDLDSCSVGNCFNPLSLPYKMYKNGDIDNTIDLLENVAYYFCSSEVINNNVDPFWENSAMSLFVGLSLYLFKYANEDEINISTLLDIASKFDKFKEKFEQEESNSPIYINLSSIVLAPMETKNSILSVFMQSIRLFITRQKLLNLLCKTDFDIENIQKEKTALFIISNNKPYLRRLIPLIIDQCYKAALYTDYKGRRLNILIDEFENLIPIKNFSNILTYSRSNNIRFNIYIRSLLDLRNVYGYEGTEVLKIIFGNIIYLLANDTETLECISKLCGNKETEKGLEPLISIDELKLLEYFEAIVLIPRTSPIRTKLIPDYKIDWKFSDEKVELKPICENKIKKYDI